jgi:O-6-methylguanine DNA methyltransferase
VRSYKWVARRIGRPCASRAVGNALNKNPYPGIIPCHRVIKSDGTPGGFAKGVEMKLAMLEKEGIRMSAQNGKRKTQNRNSKLSRMSLLKSSRSSGIRLGRKSAV